MLSLTLFLSLSVAQVTCQDGSAHPNVRAAAELCSHLVLGPGVHEGPVTLRSGGSISGAGREQTFLLCDAGPCLTVLPKTEVRVSGLTIGSRDLAIAARDAKLTLIDAAVVPIEDSGGRVRLRDTTSTFVRVEVEVASRRPPPIEATAQRGENLYLEDVHFRGVSPASGTPGAVYSVAYGVICTGCYFDPIKAVSRVPESWVNRGRPPEKLREAAGDSRWSTLSCPGATPQDRARCSKDCGEESVAVCRMVYDGPTETCVPKAVCADANELL